MSRVRKRTPVRDWIDWVSWFKYPYTNKTTIEMNKYVPVVA